VTINIWLHRLAVRACRKIEDRSHPSTRLGRKALLSLETLESRWMPSVSTTWTGFSHVDTNWSNPANWSNGVPDAGTEADFTGTFAGLRTVRSSTLDPAFLGAVGAIAIDDTWSGRLTGNLGSLLTVNGSFTIGLFSTFQAAGQNVNVNGLTAVAGGNYRASIGTQNLNGGLTIETAATVAMSGGMFQGASGTVNTTNVTITEGALGAPTGTFNVSGNWSATGSDSSFFPDGGTVTFTGSAPQTIDQDAVNVGGFNNVVHAGTSSLQLINHDLEVDGGFTNAAGTLTGTGTIRGFGTTGAVVNVTGGAVMPGNNGVGTLTVGTINFSSASTFMPTVGASSLGTLVVTGSINLGGTSGNANGSTLSTQAVMPFLSTVGDTFTVIQNSTGSSAGTFNGLAEGAHIAALNNQDFTISYVGGTSGHDVVLSHVDTPPSFAGPLTVSSPSVEGASTTLTGAFVDPDPFDAFILTINWGDGSAAEVINLSTLSPVQTPQNQTFSATHTYAAESQAGGFAITVSVSDGHPGGSATASAAAVVDEAQLTNVAAVGVSGSEGVDSGLVTVATFTDPAASASGNNSVAPYAASINWGDGSGLDSSTVSIINSGGNSFTVLGHHQYGQENGYVVTVTLQHDSLAALTVSGTATVAETQLSNAGGVPFNSAAGADSGVVTLATFTDPGGSEPNASDLNANPYTASVDWGDGSGLDSASVAIVSTGTNTFAVTGHHTYASANSYTVTVTIQHELAAALTVSSTATVSGERLIDVAGTEFKAREGKSSGRVTVATFADSGGADPAIDYSAVIDWGDGTASSSGKVVATHDGHFAVRGRHTYDEEGAYTVTVTINHQGGSATVTTRALVSDAPLSIKSKSGPSEVEQGESFTRALVTFTDADRQGKLSDYSATIFWGDGTSSAGSIRQDGHHFAVLGTHTYGQAGKKKLLIRIEDAGGAFTEATVKVMVTRSTPPDENTPSDIPFRPATPAIDIFFEQFEEEVMYLWSLLGVSAGPRSPCS
jgi:hypothetical protein